MARIIGGARLPTIAYVANAANSSSPLNTFNMTGASFGDESPRRQLLAIVFGINANIVSDSNYTTAVTIGGVAATRVFAPGANRERHWTAWLTPRTEDSGPSGASGNVAATRSTGNGYSSVGVTLFALYDLLDTSAPFDAVADETENGSTPTASIALDMAGGGVAAAMAHSGEAGAVQAWSGGGMVEVYEATGGVSGSERYSAATATKTAGGADVAISVDNAAQFISMLGLSFR